MGRIKLFCIPYAGGASTIFYEWKKYISPSIELVPIELAGRGLRFSEPLYDTIEEASKDIFSMIKKEITNSSYAIFGHSMGALIAFEVIHKLINNNYHSPICAFFSGKNPPHFSTATSFHLLNNKEFWSAIQNIGGTPKEVLVNKELRELFGPILKQDFKIVENYRQNVDRKKFNFGIEVLIGKNDNIPNLDKIKEWDHYTNKEINFQLFDGDHFFINDQKAHVIKYINEQIQFYKKLQKNGVEK